MKTSKQNKTRSFSLTGIFSLVIISSFVHAESEDRITYTIKKAANPTADQLARYTQHDRNMREIVRLYNEHAVHIKGVHITLDDRGPTGRSAARMNEIYMYGNAGLWTYMHEVNHALGMGTSWRYGMLRYGRKLYGSESTKFAREDSGNPALVLSSDGHAFWPYGINYPKEASTEGRRINAVRMMDRIWYDMRKLDMWTSRQLQPAKGQCLYIDDTSQNVVSGACKNSVAHAWDIFKTSNTENTIRIKSISTGLCLAAKKDATGSALVAESCDTPTSIWEKSTTTEIQNKSAKNMCLFSKNSDNLGLGVCSADAKIEKLNKFVVKLEQASTEGAKQCAKDPACDGKMLFDDAQTKINGKTVYFHFGYPSGWGSHRAWNNGVGSILDLVDYSGFTYQPHIPGSWASVFTLNDASDPSQCKVTYQMTYWIKRDPVVRFIVDSKGC